MGFLLLILLVCCVVLLCVFTFWVQCCDVSYDFRIKTVWLVFTSSCVLEDACHIYVICVGLRIVVSNAYCHFLIATSVFSKVYLSNTCSYGKAYRELVILTHCLIGCNTPFYFNWSTTVWMHFMQCLLNYRGLNILW